MWKTALRAVWRAKILWLEATALTAVLVLIAYAWLGLAVATLWHIAWHIVLALLGLGIIGLGVWLTRRRLGGVGVTAAQQPMFWLAGVVSLVAALGVPYALLHWVPGFDGFGMQFGSACARTALAGLIFTGALLWLHACGVAATSTDAAVEHREDGGTPARLD